MEKKLPLFPLKRWLLRVISLFILDLMIHQWWWKASSLSTVSDSCIQLVSMKLDQIDGAFNGFTFTIGGPWDQLETSRNKKLMGISIHAHDLCNHMGFILWRQTVKNQVIYVRHDLMVTDLFRHEHKRCSGKDMGKRSVNHYSAFMPMPIVLQF